MAVAIPFVLAVAVGTVFGQVVVFNEENPSFGVHSTQESGHFLETPSGVYLVLRSLSASRDVDASSWVFAVGRIPKNTQGVLESQVTLYFRIANALQPISAIGTTTSGQIRFERNGREVSTLSGDLEVCWSNNLNPMEKCRWGTLTLTDLEFRRTVNVKTELHDKALLEKFEALKVWIDDVNASGSAE